MNSVSIILISRLIFSMNITPKLKTKLQYCVTYGVKYSAKADLDKRFKRCKLELLGDNR